MKQIYQAFLLFILLHLSIIQVFAANGTLSGAGTDLSPYLVEDYLDLKKVGTTAIYTKAKVYRLKNDIDASASKTELAGAGFIPIGAALATTFSGKFHGAGYTIKNLYINRSTTNNVGLFGYLTGLVDSLRMDSCKIVGKWYVGSVAGYINTTAVVNNCVAATDTVQAIGTYAGGVVGYSLKGIIRNCTNNAVVNATTGIGGILGYASTTTTITNCTNYANITSTGYNVGGIAGYFSAGVIDSCFNMGAIHAYYNVGGIAGSLLSSTLNSSYNKASVRADSINVGGCVGLGNSATIDSVYNLGSVLGKQTLGRHSVGGIVGLTSGGSLTYSYNAASVSGYQNVGGLLGKSSATNIQFCYNSGDVIGIAGYVGGAVGNSSSNISRNSYNTGIVKGNNSVGGMAGQSFSSEFSSAYNAGAVTGNTYVSAFAGFNYEGNYTNSYYDLSNSNYTRGVGYPLDSDTMLVSLDAKQMLDTAFIDSLDYLSVWQIRNDSTYPALRGLDNAPFAINDSIYLSAKDLLIPFACNRLLENDFDFETLQANLVFKLRTISAGTTDSLVSILLPAMQNLDTLRLSYRLGESRIALSDTLWGNTTRSLLIMDNHTPTLLTDSFSLYEDSLLTFPITLNDIDGDNSSFALIDSTKNGALLVLSDSIRYTPYTGYSGLDSLQIEISDGLAIDSVWIRLNVIDINNRPIARDTSVTVILDTRFALKAPVTDEDSVLDIHISSFPTQGVASINGDSIIYTPNLDAIGPDTLLWYAIDSAFALSDTVRVIYNIAPQQISVSADTLYLEAFTDATDYVLVNSNTHWSVQNNESWLSFSKVEQAAGDTLRFVVADNPNAETRESIVNIITSGLAAIELHVIQRAKVQLEVQSAISISKLYDATSDVDFTLGKLIHLADEDTLKLSLFAIAFYDNAAVGDNKTITLQYSISGDAMGKYLAPVDTVITIASILPKQLQITAATLAVSKLYDSNTQAAVSAGSLLGVEAVDLGSVSVLAQAEYDSAKVGNNKTITLSYVLQGDAASNYLAPADSIITTASILPLQLTITAPNLVLHKMYDGNTSATINSVGSLQGVFASDIAYVNVSVEASYTDASVAVNKTIRVVYTLSGDAAANYISPSEQFINTASIAAWVTLSPLATAVLDCSSSVLSVPYHVETGEPNQYRIVFGDEAHTAGFNDIAYTNLASTTLDGVINIAVSNKNLFGNYTATVYMRNQLGYESAAYPLSFLINAPAALLIPKFDDVILVDNISQRFVAYQWYKNGTLISGANAQVYADNAGLVGTYIAKLTTTEGEQFYTCPKVLNIALRSASILEVYPNPIRVNEPCSVQLNTLSSADLVGAELFIFDSTGRKVFASKQVQTENSITFAQQTGVFVLRILLADGRVLTQKIIVK